jgi:hypothetical protein
MYKSKKYDLSAESTIQCIWYITIFIFIKPIERGALVTKWLWSSALDHMTIAIDVAIWSLDTNLRS